MTHGVNLEDGNSQWVECGHGNGWTKKQNKKTGPLEENPHLRCGGAGVWKWPGIYNYQTYYDSHYYDDSVIS